VDFCFHSTSETLENKLVGFKTPLLYQEKLQTLKSQNLTFSDILQIILLAFNLKECELMITLI
jgi:hypothetical protein